MEVNFEEVWNRVKGTEQKDELQQLYDFAAEEHMAAADYSRLADCTGSLRAKKLFRELAAEEREHEKQLRACLYLRKGKETDQRPKTVSKRGGMLLRELRRLYDNEQKSADAYSAAAKNLGDDQLRILYAQLAEREREHGKALWKLLMELM